MWGTVRGIMGGTGKQYPQNQTTPFQRTIFVQTYILMYSILNVKFIRKKCSAFSNFHVQFILPLTNRKKCTNMMNMTIVQCQRYGFIDRFCIKTQTWLFHKYCSLCVVSTIAVNNISFTGLEHYTTQTIK